MDANSLIITISIVLAAIAFVVLVVFLVMTLLSVTKSLKRTERLIDNSNEIAKNVNEKLHVLDPFFNRVSEVGEIVEKKACCVERMDEEKKDKNMELAASVFEFVEWGLLGAALVMKLRRKK